MAYHRQEKSWTERAERDEAVVAPTGDIDGYLRKQAFRHSSTSLGVMGHWVGLAGTMAPIIIGELIADPGKRWRAVRLASVGTAIAYEALYTFREAERRKEQDAKLADCKTRPAV